MAKAFNRDVDLKGTAKLTRNGNVLCTAGSVNPSHIVVAAGEHTTAGGDTDETITAAAVVATDIVLVTLQTAGSTPVTIVDAAAGAGVINVDTSADPSTDHVLSYMALRAVS